MFVVNIAVISHSNIQRCKNKIRVGEKFTIGLRLHQIRSHQGGQRVNKKILV